MNANKNSPFFNTESPSELLKAAQTDIEDLCDIVESKRFDNQHRVGRICRYATEAVEKMLKAYIVDFDPTVKVFGIHDLNYLYDIIYPMDNSFSVLKDKLKFLNNFSPNLRYSSPFNIDEHEVKRCLRELKDVYDFPLIKNLRDQINQQNNFILLPEDINTLFGKYMDF